MLTRVSDRSCRCLFIANTRYAVRKKQGTARSLAGIFYARGEVSPCEGEGLRPQRADRNIGVRALGAESDKVKSLGRGGGLMQEEGDTIENSASCIS